MKALAYATEFLYSLLLAPFAHVARLLGYAPQRVTIVGWWGSETIGDIAILGQLLAELSPLCAAKDLRVVSFNASLTRRSLRQLKRTEIAVVPLGLLSALQLVTSRTVIFGGGPLMESPAMRFWAWNARVARFTGARVMLYANGIGPLRTPSPSMAVAVLVHRATHVVLRDSLAQHWAIDYGGRSDAVLSFDPAYDFVRNLGFGASAADGIARKPHVALGLRTPPASYLGQRDVNAATRQFLLTVAGALDAVAEQRDVEFVGIVMHAGTAESDDHAVYAQLRSLMRRPERLRVAPGEHSIEHAVATLHESRAAFTVRFHAMIFALATDTPVVAVDYARPDGKVSAAAADVGRSADVIAWDDLSAALLTERLLKALDAPAATAPDLGAKSRARRAVLGAAIGAPRA